MRETDPDRIDGIIEQLYKVLGGQAQAVRWLRSPNQALGGRIPLELLDTDLGRRQIEEILGRIEQGVYS